MRAILSKLGKRGGETLVEALAAILLIALSVAALGSMTMAAIKLNNKSKSMSQSFYSEISAAEKCEGTSEGVVHFSGIDRDVTVRYTGGDGALTAYRAEGD